MSPASWRGRLPDIPVSLFLHNDPQTMRGARTPAERAALLRTLACVATVSEFLRARMMEGVAGDPPSAAMLANAIDLSALPPARPNATSWCCSPAELVAEKGADSFVAACARALPALAGWRAEAIGADRSRVDSPETPFVRALRVSARAAGVRMLGYRPYPAVLAP